MFQSACLNYLTTANIHLCLHIDYDYYAVAASSQETCSNNMNTFNKHDS